MFEWVVECVVECAVECVVEWVGKWVVECVVECAVEWVVEWVGKCVRTRLTWLHDNYNSTTNEGAWSEVTEYMSGRLDMCIGC